MLTGPDGFAWHRAALDRDEQAALLAEVVALVDAAGWVRPRMPRSGRPFSIETGNLGTLGWVSDERGYRYQPRHPETGAPWPAMPERVVGLWRRFAPSAAAAECCLVNRYRGAARLGLHRDEDEEDRTAPVVSLSLGDTAIFRLGGLARGDPSRSMTLASGDVVVLGGTSRLAYHGVDRILAGSSTLVPGGGRLNLTLRRVRPPSSQEALLHGAADR